MKTFVKSAGWTIAVAAAHVSFIIGWTLAIGVLGALLITSGFAVIDWITGVARWEKGYAAHLGDISASIATGIAMPVGAALALWRFQVKRSRRFNTYSLDDTARIGVTLLCYALAALFIIIPLYLAGGQVIHAVEAVDWSGTASEAQEGLSRKLRVLPLLIFAMAVLGLAEQARRQ